MSPTAELRALRDAFPLLDRGTTFLDWAATGLIPAVTHRELGAWLDRLATCEPGTSTWIHGEGATTRNVARREVAGLLGVEPDSIALVESTTAGLHRAASVVPTRKGQNAVLAASDYLAVAMPWRHRQSEDGLELRFVPSVEGAIRAADLLAAVDENTAVVSVSTVAWTSGVGVDIDALARGLAGHPAALIIDAVQSFGAQPVPCPARVDFLAAGGHKWLCSPLGAGFLYASAGAIERFGVPSSGFLSAEGPGQPWYLWFEDPASRITDPVRLPASGRAFETGGTPSYPGALGLGAFLGLLGQVDPEVRARHVAGLRAQLVDGLVELGWRRPEGGEPSVASGITVLRMSEGVEAERALVGELAKRRILASVRYAGGVGGVRISLHAMNDGADVQRLLAALEECGANSGLAGFVTDAAHL